MSSQTVSSIAQGVRARTHLPEADAKLGRLPPDEVVNTITHGIGIPLSLAAGTILLSAAVQSGGALRLSGCLIYALCLVGVFTASTLSHCFVCPRRRHFFRALDQALIYLLVAGSYTPFALIYLNQLGWNVLLVLMWAIALTGFASKLFFSHRVNACRAWSYVLLAWLTAIPAVATIGTVPVGLHIGAFLGAAAFMLGMVFYLLDIKRFHFHAMWHILVIAGCTCHFMAIYSFVALAG